MGHSDSALGRGAAGSGEPPPAAWTAIGWNGVELAVPADWGLMSYGRRYLLLDDGDAAVLELKWERIRGAFSHARHLKKLRLTARTNLGEIDPPESWPDLSDRYDARAFAWRDENGRRGLGAALLCRECKNAVLIQFLGPAVDDDDVQRRVLAGLRDHPSGGRVLWSVFDFQARTPEALSYRSALFQPGRFELTFGFEKSQVRLHRWAPATVLLKDGGLADFGRSRFRWSDGRWRMEDENGASAVAEKSPAGLAAAPVLRRLGPTPRYMWARLWTPGVANRILGVSAEGPRPLDRELLEGLSLELDVVST